MRREIKSWWNPLIVIDLVKEAKGAYVETLGLIAAILLSYMMVLIIPALIVSKLFLDEPKLLYSEGVMHAKSAKLSTKGIFWKTNEGYIMTGAINDGVAAKWHFSTQSQEVIKCINSNSSVTLTYDHYIVVPFSIGSSSHIVTECKPKG